MALFIINSARLLSRRCCSARNTAHVGDLHPAPSNSSVQLVSFQIVVISTCLWPSHCFVLFRKSHPSLVIVHLRPGSRHVVKPSVVMILVAITCFSHVLDFNETACWNLLVQEPSLSHH